MKKRILLDASSLNNSGCIRKYYLNNIHGYKPKNQPEDVSAVYGSAYHIFKEVLKKHKDENLAQLCAQQFFKLTPKYVSPKKEWMTLGHLTQTILAHFEHLKVSPDNFESLVSSEGKPLVEQTVCIPYFQDEFMEILLAGTIDDIGKIKNGCYLLKDIKTTSSWNSKEYFQGYALSHQLMFYLLIVKWLAEHYPDSIFREMVSKGRIGCAIEGVFLSPTKPTQFIQSEVFFYSDEQLEDFEISLKFFIQKIRSYIMFEDLPLREGIINQACQGRFPGKPCEYLKMCSSCDIVVEKHMLNNMFEPKGYNPLQFRSIPQEIQTMIDNYGQHSKL